MMLAPFFSAPYAGLAQVNGSPAWRPLGRPHSYHKQRLMIVKTDVDNFEPRYNGVPSC